MKGGTEGYAEWASEGKPKQVGKPEMALRDQSQRMMVRIKVGAQRQAGWHRRIDFSAPVPAFFVWDRSVFCP